MWCGVVWCACMCVVWVWVCERPSAAAHWQQKGLLSHGSKKPMGEMRCESCDAAFSTCADNIFFSLVLTSAEEEEDSS